MEVEEEVEEVRHPLPPKIRRLHESVVNRIAAGEVIQRPVSAVKELIENSLDAGATSINVTLKDGGLKLIQVSDNGHGIRFEDLPILCERHTTSKLSAYEDLQTIRSMGFRGEALASMTYVGHVSVTTITEGQLHGYRVSYKDGVMEHEPKACAAVKGTQIMIENLFYNMVARRKTLQNSNDDYSKIVDLICRFSIHHVNVNFSCRKHGASRPDVHTVGTGSRIDAIRAVYGASVSNDLVDVTASDDNPSRSIFKMEGFISNSNYVAKKTIMVLFINDRLVECSSLKRAIEVVYTSTLPKASKPFIYMSITLPREHVDVNVHPTKREVSLLNQESIVETIQKELESKLRSSNKMKVFHTQVVFPSVSSVLSGNKETKLGSSPSGSKTQKVPVSKLVRTDSQCPHGRLHAFLLEKQPVEQHKKILGMASIRSAIVQRRNPKETADLTSVQELVDEIDQNTHPGLLDIVRDCSYIGMADDTFALLQHGTRLYLANVINLSKELIYQQSLRRFAHFNAIQLSEPAPLYELLMMAQNEEDMEAGTIENDELKERIAEKSVELLKSNAEMLLEYFCIEINEEGNLCKLPVILDQYTPDIDHIPEFVLALSNDINWNEEKDCFQSISAVLANFYALRLPLLPNPSAEGLQFYKRSGKPVENIQNENSEAISCADVTIVPVDSDVVEDDIDHELLSEAETTWAQREWTIQHVLFPAMRLFLKPPKATATNGTFVQIASLEKLYRVFERC